MKKILILLFSISTICSIAQPTTFGNFKVVEQEIIYQKIFVQDSLSVPVLEEYYKALPYVSNVVVKPDGLQFEVNDIMVDYKKFQFSQVSTPPIIQTGKYSGKVTLSIKDDKYRITFHTLQVTGDIGYKKITTKENLTNYSCKNNGTVISQDWCKPNMLGLLDQAFTDKLQFVAKKKVDEGDW